MSETVTRPTHAQLREQCLELGDMVRELRSADAEKRTPNWAADLKAATLQLHAVDAEYTAAVRAHEVELEQRTSGGPRAATGRTGGDMADYRTAGQRFIESSDIAEWAQRGAQGASPMVEIERRTLLTSGTASNDAGALLPQGSPFIAPGGIDRRRLYIRDLVAPGTTTLSSVPYVREYTPRTTETAATGVAEGAAKPEAALLFVAADAPVRKIAASEVTLRQVAFRTYNLPSEVVAFTQSNHTATQVADASAAAIAAISAPRATVCSVRLSFVFPSTGVLADRTKC